ncbi:hypothetical protein Ae201684P_021776 [Aphanomyces euteiches]|nr:hypothetical protein Ae201684P_021776 [Aphanomyces euteiches]
MIDGGAGDAGRVNLSERGLTSDTADRALHMFPAAHCIDLSRNNIDAFPRHFPTQLLSLNLSLNAITSLGAVGHLRHLRVIDLSYNRLDDVGALIFCTELRTVDLRGNRLTSTKGFESLKHLERVDLSENVIEEPEAIRSLSLNTSLTTLSLKGNPIANTLDYRIMLLDLVPQVSFLDGKRYVLPLVLTFSRYSDRQSRQQFRCPQANSYAYMYDAKKQFQCMRSNSTQGMPTATLTRARLRNHSAPAPSSSPMELVPQSSPLPTTFPTQDISTVHRPAPAHASYCPKSLRTSSAPSMKLDKYKRQKAQEQVTSSTPVYVSLFDRVADASGVKRCPSTGKPKVATKRKNVISPPKGKVQAVQLRNGGTFVPRRQLMPNDDRAAECVPNKQDSSLNRSQIKVLGLIQDLIQHKRQTIATLNKNGQLTA